MTMTYEQFQKSIDSIYKKMEKDNLRDFFAGCALIGSTIRWGDEEYSCEEAAKIMYDFADVMIKVRNQER